MAGSKSDQEFAATINRVVGLLNNGHTRLRGRGDLLPWFQLDSTGREILEPWVRILDEVDLGTAEYWLDLARAVQKSGYLLVTYSAGQYVVAGRSAGISGRALPIGSVVTEVNGVDVDEFVNSHRGLSWQPYDPIRKKTYERVLRLPEGQNTVTVIVPDGSCLTETFKVVAAEAPRSLLSPEMDTGPFTLKTTCLSGCVIDGQVGYLAINQMGADMGRVPEGELNGLRQFLSSVAGLPALIIDIRGNPGGENVLWDNLVSMMTSKTLRMDLIVALRDGEHVSPLYDKMLDSYGFVPLDDGETDAVRSIPPDVLRGGFRAPIGIEMAIEPAEDSIKYAGKVFLLVDDRVYSAAENFAAFSKATGFATLVGGVTGGDGLGYQLCYAVLPNSKMVVSFPLSMGINPDGSVNEEVHTYPDYLVEWDAEDIARWVANPGRSTDVVLQECLRLAKAP